MIGSTGASSASGVLEIPGNASTGDEFPSVSMSHDAGACRRGLREISEIAAVASLENSQMSAQEALSTIAAIAEWVDEEEDGARADCSDIIGRLNDLTGSVDFEVLDDRAAFDMFRSVLGVLRR
ncbi:MAG TPA: hypothetical protein VF633_04580 [Brevundimonas sp.]|jgi:hypothetical protein